MPSSFHPMSIIFGGASRERGISINSARSIYDNRPPQIEVCGIYYLSPWGKVYRVKEKSLYSNTPQDFDFRLRETHGSLTLEAMAAEIKASNSYAFNVIHGKWGEDGMIQAVLEDHDVPFLGSNATAASQMFDKFHLSSSLQRNNIRTPQQILITRDADGGQSLAEARKFCKQCGTAVIKPRRSGSSIDVQICETPSDVQREVKSIFTRTDSFGKFLYEDVLLQEYVSGIEFTIIIIENRQREPICLIPTEIELKRNSIFTTRQKYFPSEAVDFFTPPRTISPKGADFIREEALKAFKALKARHLLRIDGRLTANNEVLFFDANPITGMEQSSVFFQQALYAGFTHETLISHLAELASDGPVRHPRNWRAKKKVFILMGGDSSERDISLSSGRNVLNKLNQSRKYSPTPILLSEGVVYNLPPRYFMLHTVRNIKKELARDSIKWRFLRRKVAQFFDHRDGVESHVVTSLAEFLDGLGREDVVFLALHGGIGEDGTIQAELERRRIVFTGSNSRACQLCISKYRTGQFIRKAKISGICTLNRVRVTTEKLKDFCAEEHWQMLQKKLFRIAHAQCIVGKPESDGSSTGVARLASATDLTVYSRAMLSLQPIHSGQLLLEKRGIAAPTEEPKAFIFEPYLACDAVREVHGNLSIEAASGYIEITIGVLQTRSGWQVLTPSLTVSEQGILTAYEKFQEGVGVNLTPPPPSIITRRHIQLFKRRIRMLVLALNLGGYSRLDCFIHRTSAELILLEVNTTPGLTPSTVLFQQAAHDGIGPRLFVEMIIDSAILKSSAR